jgi:hypothetical protein
MTGLEVLASSTAIAAMFTISLTSTPRCSTYGLRQALQDRPDHFRVREAPEQLVRGIRGTRFGKTRTFASP